MSNQNQRNHEKKLEEGKTLPAPKDVWDKADQNRAKASVNNKKS